MELKPWAISVMNVWQLAKDFELKYGKAPFNLHVAPNLEMDGNEICFRLARIDAELNFKSRWYLVVDQTYREDEWGFENESENEFMRSLPGGE